MIDKIDVFAKNTKVGTLVIYDRNKIAFKYSQEWIETGFSLNPFKLPLINQIFYSDSPYFKGLFGVFADSLPDSYGELLLIRYLKRSGLDIKGLNPLERLYYVGKNGMGLLEYVPCFDIKNDSQTIDFDFIQKEVNELFDSKEVQDIETLYSLGGSSGGARPKSHIKYKGEEYIVKFSSRFDPKNIAEIEYNSMRLAKEAGINIPDIELLETQSGNKYFLIKRFDREGDRKIHMISVAALLEIDFNSPTLDYHHLIKLTRILTNNTEDVLEMFRRMVFNVLIGNQDDHAKNFSFLYKEEENSYRLSPAYDITQTRTYYGEHTTTVNGKGKNITDYDMLEVAKKNEIDLKIAEEIIKQCKAVSIE